MADEQDDARTEGAGEGDDPIRSSLDDLGARIEAARAGSNGNGGNGGGHGPRRSGVGGWLIGVSVVLVAVLIALVAGTGDDDGDGDLAAGGSTVTSEVGGAPVSTTDTTAAPTSDTTAAPTTAAPTTEAPTTTAAPATTEAPTTTAAPTTTTTAPTTTTTAAPTTTAPAPTTTTAPPDPEPAPPPPPSTGPPTTGQSGPSEWTVQPGDSFWSVAERLVSDELGRQATDAEVGPMWWQLVDANADRLVEPGNADLIFPGQTMVLPATAAVP